MGYGLVMPVSHCLREFGPKAYSALTRPHVIRQNQKARLTLAEEHVVWLEENWSKVHFRGEKKINLVGFDEKPIQH